MCAKSHPYHQHYRLPLGGAPPSLGGLRQPLRGLPLPPLLAGSQKGRTIQPCSKSSLDHLCIWGQGPPLGRPCGVLLSAASPAPRPPSTRCLSSTLAPSASGPLHVQSSAWAACLSSYLFHPQSPSLRGLPDPPVYSSPALPYCFLQHLSPPHRLVCFGSLSGPSDAWAWLCVQGLACSRSPASVSEE